MFIHCVKLAGKNKLTPNNCYVFSGSIDFSGKKMDFGNLDFGIEIRCRRGGECCAKRLVPCSWGCWEQLGRAGRGEGDREPYNFLLFPNSMREDKQESF